MNEPLRHVTLVVRLHPRLRVGPWLLVTETGGWVGVDATNIDAVIARLAASDQYLPKRLLTALTPGEYARPRSLPWRLRRKLQRQQARLDA